MKKITVLMLSILMCLFLCACSKENTSSGNGSSLASKPDCLPVLAINTIDQSESAMDFVTKPVARLVSSAIASWTPGYKIPLVPFYKDCKITITGTDGVASLFDAEAQVKVRGNWTTNYPKKGLRIKFTEKQNLLGLNNGAEMKNWVLLAEYKDGSMLRNKAALQIANEILNNDGLYAADACLVEVVINGEYWGVYLLSELQQVNENRVAITEPEKDYTGTDIGYFMELDGYSSYEDPIQYFNVDYASCGPLVPFDGEGGGGRTYLPEGIPGFTIKSDIYSPEQRQFILSYMNNVYKIMYAAAYEDKAYVFNEDYTEIYESDTVTPQGAVELAVDVKSLADMYIISELTCDADIYWSSFFMDVDFGEGGNKKLTFEAPWDFDSAVGNRDRCADGTGFHCANLVWDVNSEYQTMNPWLAVLAYEDWFQELVSAKWKTVYADGVFDRAFAMIEEDAMQYSAAFERNYRKWNNIENREGFGTELSPQSFACTNHEEAAAHLLEWLKARVEFLNGHWGD